MLTKLTDFAKDIARKTNYVLVILLLSFSCSTNQTSKINLSLFPVEYFIKEIKVTDRRFIVAKEIAQYKPLAIRAENFFNYLNKNPVILNRLTFTHTTDSREFVLIKIKQSEGLIISSVEKYFPVWRFSRVIAYQRGVKIYFNGYRLKRDDCEIINTFVHEYLHRLGYSHGDNEPTGKEFSVPYFIGKLAEKACLENKI